MQLYPLKLVTIVAEHVLREQLERKILEMGVTGYTCTPATGYGSRGARHSAGADNVKLEMICPEAVAINMLTYVSHHYFDRYACIAWITDVAVVRGAHYVKK